VRVYERWGSSCSRGVVNIVAAAVAVPGIAVVALVFLDGFWVFTGILE
jgi:hypothetical protein